MWMLRRLKGLWYDLKYGVFNLKDWFWIVWRDRDWDWCFLAEMMERKMLRMAYLQEKCGCSVDALEIARELRQCATDLRTLIDDEMPDVINRDTVMEHERNQREVQMRLGITIGQRLRYWWD